MSGADHVLFLDILKLTTEAFENGINWENLSGMLLGLALVVGGLALAFGTVGAAIGALVGGVLLAILAFNEWATTGTLTNEACIALTAGIIAIGGAISLLTGSWIPLIIGWYKDSGKTPYNIHFGRGCVCI